MTVNGSGTPVSWYFNVLADDKVVGRQPNTGSRSYYQTDLLGTTRSVVQGATIIESRDYDPWGVLMPGRTLGTGTKEGFTGKERDTESGLDYFGARYYMAALGRWAARDEMGEKHPEWSPYNYVLDDPLGLVDPDGNQVYVNPQFDAGMAYGEWQGLKRSVNALGSIVAHPIRTAEGLGALATDPGIQALAVASALQSLQEDLTTLLHGDSFSAGEVVGGVAESVAEAVLVSHGLGALGDALGAEAKVGDVVARTGPRGVDPVHHNANVAVTDVEGRMLTHERLVSGNMTAEEKALPFPSNTLASHTEARAVRNIQLKEGQTMTITGQKARCPSCKGAMRKAAERSGAKVQYQWREDGVTRRWPPE